MIRLEPVRAPGPDTDDLADFLLGNRFPFHAGPRATAERVRERIDQGAWALTWWLVHDELGRIGIVRVEDVDDEVGEDDTPMFDLRLAERFRGRGLAVEALGAITDHVFTTWPVRRFEGCTRVDNLAMRATFRRAAWVKEAHYRDAWSVPGAAPLDAVGYAILRRDWADGTTTPVRFDDEPSA